MRARAIAGGFAVPLAAFVMVAAGGAAEPVRPAGATAPETMKAIRYHANGGPEVLVYEDAPKPVPGSGEILVQVRAAAVNPVDWKVVKRAFGGSADLPRIPGYDLAGVVEKTGEGVSRFKPGDAVMAYVSLRRGGAYAEYAIVGQDEAAAKPASIDFVHAAAIPLAALTAWQALFDTAQLRAGQSVLIHGAAGGVGSFAVQLAKARGATVAGTASASNHDFLRTLGADKVIDYRAEKFEEVVKDADVVLDTIGGETLQRSFAAVKDGGFVVSITDDPSRSLPAGRQVRTAGILVKPDGRELAEIGALVETGKVKPVVSEVLPLSEARRAFEMSQGGHTRGKIVLRVRE